MAEDNMELEQGDSQKHQPIDIDSSFTATGDEIDEMRATPTPDGKNQLENYGARSPLPPRNLSDFELEADQLKSMRVSNGVAEEEAEELRLASVSRYSDASLNGRPDIQSGVINSVRKKIASLKKRPIEVRFARANNRNSNNH